MIDFSKSYGCTWRFVRIDPESWSEVGDVKGFVGASIRRTTGAEYESGSFRVDGTIDGGYVRVIAYVSQDGSTERIPVATMLVEDDSKRDGVSSYVGRSVLYPASVVGMPIGSYVLAGQDCAAYVAKILGQYVKAPIEVDGSFSLASSYVFDIGSTVLDSVRTVLDAAGWCIRVDGSGTITVSEIPTSPIKIHPSLVLTGERSTGGISAVPNRYVAMLDGVTAYAENNDADSDASTASRTYIRDADGRVDTAPTPLSGETIDAYCARRLEELSVSIGEHDYEREYVDGVTPWVLVDTPFGAGRVVSQEVVCGGGISVSETIEERRQLWTR